MQCDLEPQSCGLCDMRREKMEGRCPCQPQLQRRRCPPCLAVGRPQRERLRPAPSALSSRHSALLRGLSGSAGTAGCASSCARCPAGRGGGAAPWPPQRCTPCWPRRPPRGLDTRGEGEGSAGGWAVGQLGGMVWVWFGWHCLHSYAAGACSNLVPRMLQRSTTPSSLHRSAAPPAMSRSAAVGGTRDPAARSSSGTHRATACVGVMKV